MLKTIAGGTAVAVGLGLMIGTAMAGAVGALFGGAAGLALGGTTVTALALGGAFGKRFPQQVRHVSFDCRHSRRPVDAALLVNADSFEVLDVCTCSVFEPPEKVGCAKRCMQDLSPLPASRI